MPSRTIALCWEYCWTTVGSWFPAWLASSAARWPRWYSAFVIRWNAFVPSPVNCRVTSGWPVSEAISALMPDSTRSLPVSSGGPFGDPGLVLNRYQYVLSFDTPFAVAPMQPFLTGQAIARRCAGTARICVCSGRLPPYRSRSCLRVGANPGGSCWGLVTVLVFVTVFPLTFVLTCLTTFLRRKR